MINEPILKEALALISTKKYKLAISELVKITSQYPELEQAWLYLSKCYKEIGELKKQTAAYDQFEMIAWFNKQLSCAEKDLLLGDFHNTQLKVQKLLKLVPNEKRCLLLLSKAAFKAADMHTYHNVSQYNYHCNPSSPAVVNCYFEALFHTKHFNEFIELANKKDKKTLPNHIISLLAACHVKQMNFDLAYNLYADLERKSFHPSTCLLRMGNIKKIIGEPTTAVQLYKKALEKDKTNTEAYWNLANLKTYKFSESEIIDLQALIGNLTSQNKKALGQFALGKAHEQQNNFYTAYKHYAAGNKIKNNHIKYTQSKFNYRCIKFLTKDLIHSLPRVKPSSIQLVFVVGMPRSGSTLVEQILASHSKVDSSYELTEIISIASFLEQQNKSPIPYSLDSLSQHKLSKLSARYLKFIEPLRTNKPIFVDKLPANYQHIGLIMSLFPNAKIIDVRRDNRATAWSLYKHIFSEGHAYTYSFENLATYIKKYYQLMDHWKQLYPNNILTLEYEQVVEDFDFAVKKITEFCAIEIEQSCYSFYATKRPVLTPSSEQVRQPIYTSALKEWENYKPYIEPLINLLN